MRAVLRMGFLRRPTALYRWWEVPLSCLHTPLWAASAQTTTLNGEGREIEVEAQRRYGVISWQDRERCQNDLEDSLGGLFGDHSNSTISESKKLIHT